ncbi:MAG TPA: hypothetical protein VK619_13200 [Pyrinomonadaceae bacterium]|nr:hypothetical protein [Pyrinomonadaceae bacterium]
MVIRIKYRNGTEKFIPNAIDYEMNFHEGMWDIYDEKHNFPDQVAIEDDAKLERVDEPEDEAQQ